MGVIFKKEVLVSNEVVFFMAIEKTDLFYNHSLLYCIKNCSLMDFIKTNQHRFELLKKSQSKDEALVVEYNKEKDRNKNEQELSHLKEMEREIEENLEAFSKEINPQGFEMVKKAEKEQGNRVRFNFKLTEHTRLTFLEALD